MELTLTLDRDASENKFEKLIESLKPEEKIQAVALFMEKTWNNTRWGKEYFKNSIEAAISSTVSAWVKENSDTLKATVETVSRTHLTPERLNEELNRALTQVVVSSMAQGIQNSMWSYLEIAKNQLAQNLVIR